MPEAILAEPLERVQATRPCPISGTTEACVVSTRARDGSPLRNVVNCASGLVYVDPVPIEDLSAFYARDYRAEYKASAEPSPRRVLRAGHASLARFRRLWPHVERVHGKPSAELKCLDVGASSGEFGYLLASLGCTVTGCEPNEAFGRFARERLGVNVVTGMLADVKLDPGGYDLITLFHVVEHMDDPVGSLAMFRGMLRKRGVLVIEVPNILSANMGFAHKWHKGHLFGYSRETLATLAERGGFEVLELGSTGDDHNVWIVCRARGSGARSPHEPQSARANAEHFQSAVRALRANAGGRYWTRGRTWFAAVARLVRTISELRALAVRDPKVLLRGVYGETIGALGAGGGAGGGAGASASAQPPTIRP